MHRLHTRLPQLISLWAGVTAAEALLYYFFLSQPYFRAFVAPCALAVVIAATVASWRMLRARSRPDRRARDRRAGPRRLSE
jgi:hypothetical protein